MAMLVKTSSSWGSVPMLLPWNCEPPSNCHRTVKHRQIRMLAPDANHRYAKGSSTLYQDALFINVLPEANKDLWVIVCFGSSKAASAKMKGANAVDCGDSASCICMEDLYAMLL